MNRRPFIQVLLGLFGLRVATYPSGTGPPWMYEDWGSIGDYEGTEVPLEPQLSDYPEVWSEIKKDPPSALYFDIEGLSW